MSTKKDKFSLKDKNYMKLAISLARVRKGLTGEKPSVGCIITKDDKEILAGIRNNNSSYMGVGTEYGEIDREGNTKLIKTLYKGRYEIELYTIPGVSFKVPIRVNLQYRKEQEYKIDDCIAQLIVRHKKEKESGVYISEDFAHRVG